MHELRLLLQLLFTVPPLLVAVILHEVAHGWVAERLGDPTARDQGRITLNPIRHIDPFLTLLVPAVLILTSSPVVFAGAKPVPVNWLNFRNPRRGMMWVALAGPMTNFILAVISYGALRLLQGDDTSASLPRTLLIIWLSIGSIINVMLGAFNLVPIPPLDGGRIAIGLLPVPLARLLARVEPIGILLVFALLMSGLLDPFFSAILKLLVNRKVFEFA